VATVLAAALVPVATNAIGGGVIVGAVVGAGIYAAAGYIDSRYIIPGLSGKGRAVGAGQRLLGLPVGPNEAGAPRIYAIGRRVRVPAHILWTSEKIRTDRPGGGTTLKAGTGVPQRHVYVDALIAVNDRKSIAVRQLVGNGKLMVYESRNLVVVTTSEMTYAQSGGNIVVSLSDIGQPDFVDRFAVDDFVRLTGFSSSAGPSVNGLAWNVVSISAHTYSTPGSLTLKPADGQSVTGAIGVGGNAASPASITRIDDMLIVDPDDLVLSTGTSATELRVSPFARPVADVLAVGDIVIYSDGTSDGIAPSPSPTTGWSRGPSTVIGFNGEATVRLGYASSFPSPLDGKWPRITYVTQQYAATGILPSDYVPSEHFYTGSDDQDSSPIIESEIGSGNVSAYRGIAFQELYDMDITQFGDSLPFQLEALIDVDSGMTWQEALTVCCERGGVSREFVDTLGVTPAPFEGYFMRGPVTGVSNMFPLLLAGQITTQERDGVICFQDTDRADVVQIENGSQFSDFGAFVGSPDTAIDKVRFSHAAREDLPTSIGVRHQDPDNQYTDGYQHFGLRGPASADHENRQELDLSNLVLTRKQARNLAATYMRRAWINSTTVEFMLPASYCDLLEGDLVTFTDDDGRDFLVRVVQRDIGTNFVVKVVGVIEQLDIAVVGSPVQSAAGYAPPPMPRPAVISSSVLDIGPLNDSDASSPSLYVAACAAQGSAWAGVSVFKSVDDEATWTFAGTISSENFIGVLTSDLPAWHPAEEDGSSTITWQEVADGGAFTADIENSTTLIPYVPYTDPDIIQYRYNWFAIVEPDGTTEVIGAQDVSQIDDSSFALTRLIRGLRGTWQQASRSHPAGSAIIGISEHSYSAGLKIDFPGYTAPRTINLRFVPPGKDLADVPSTSIVATWRNASPFDVRFLEKSIDGGTNDATFTTDHWTRTNVPLGSVGPYPLDETYEEYKFSVWDPSGNAIRRTWTITARGTGSSALRDKSVTYTAAQQTTDGYIPGPSTTFWVSIQQVGDYGTSRHNKRQV